MLINTCLEKSCIEKSTFLLKRYILTSFVLLYNPSSHTLSQSDKCTPYKLKICSSKHLLHTRIHIASLDMSDRIFQFDWYFQPSCTLIFSEPSDLSVWSKYGRSLIFGSRLDGCQSLASRFMGSPLGYLPIEAFVV